MTAVFISHSSHDSEQATTVKTWLKSQDFENVFLDLDREGGLRAGENWERRLYEEVARCHAVILVVTPAWLNSKWCFAEFSMARSLGKVIFPILMRPGDISMIGPELGSIQAEHWNDDGKSHLVDRLNTVSHEIARGHRYSRNRPPYPGFLSFQRQDAAVFFGRDPEIRQISERLEARRAHGGARLLLVMGPSGSGKSSVVNAGVLPWLERFEQRWVVVPPFRPGESPLTRLAKALAEVTGENLGWRALRDGLVNDPAALWKDIVETVLVGPSREATLLVTLDQFEEVFATNADPEREAFLDLLALIGNRTMPVLVLATVRSDLMGELLNSRAFDVPHEVFTLGQLPNDRLPKVIEGPAQVAAINVEDGLAERVIADAISADALPLLAFALREMYERFGRSGRLTIQHYEALGDQAAGLSPLESAIRRKAEETISTAAPSRAELDALKEAFVSGLVRVNEDGVRLRRPEAIENFPKLARPLIQRMIQARLLSARGDSGEQVVEVAHEALFRAWPQLARWLEAEQDFLIGRRRIEEAREIWKSTPEAQKQSALLSGLLLEKAREWTLDHPGRLTGIRDYVMLSIRKKDRELTRARRRQLALTVTAVITAVVFAALGGAAMLQWGRAERAAEMAASEAARAQASELAAAEARAEAEDRFAMALGAVAVGLAEDDPRLALYLAAEAAARVGPGMPGFASREAIIEARQQLATDGPHRLGSPLPVGDALSIALTSDGNILATGDRDGRLRLFDARARAPLTEPLQAHAGGTESLAFDITGQLLASAGSDGSVRLWRLENGAVVSSEVIKQFSDVAWSVGFNRTGTRLAAGSETGVVKLWQIDAAGRVSELAEFEGPADMLSVAFSLDGRSVLAGTGDGQVLAWDIASGEPLFAPLSNVHTSDVWQILFSPTGERFATVSSDGSSALFAYPSGEFIEFALKREHQIQSVAFNRTGEVLIGGGTDGRLYLADPNRAVDFLRSAEGHAARIIEIAISGDGQSLASLGRDQTVRFWTLFDPVPLSQDRRIGEAAKGLALAKGGTMVAAGAASGVVHLWSGAMRSPSRLQGHQAQVWALDFTPDARWLASADRDGTIRLWDVETGTGTTLVQGSGTAVWWLGFTPDGRHLAAAGDDGLAVYDLNGELAGSAATGQRLTAGAISSDGTILATADAAGQVTLHELPSLRKVRGFRVLNDILWGLAFSPDGTLLAVAASDESASIWEVGTGERLAELGGHIGGATDLGFLSRGATLAVSDRRGQLHFWDVATGRRLAPPLPAHDRASWRLSVSDDGRRLVTTGDDGRVRSLNVLDIAFACRLGESAMDPPRQREYFGDDDNRLQCVSEGTRE